VRVWTPGPEPDLTPDEFVAAGRILSGSTSRWLPTGFSQTQFLHRVGCFSAQRIQSSDGRTFNITVPVSERLFSVPEVRRAIKVRANEEWAHDQSAISVSVDIFPSIYAASDGVIPEPGPEETSNGGHILFAYGLDDGKIFIQHGWNEWGDEGKGTLPDEYLSRHHREAWFLRQHIGPEPETVTHLRQKAKAAIPGGVGRWSGSNTSHGLKVFTTWLISAGTGNPLQLSLVLNRRSESDWLMVGWMLATKRDDLCEVQEYFVWPPYRCRGVGTVLAGHALLSLARLGCLRIRWLHSVADVRSRSMSEVKLPRWLSIVRTDTSRRWGISKESKVEALHRVIDRVAGISTPGGITRLRVHEIDRVVITASEHRLSKSGIILGKSSGACGEETHVNCIVAREYRQRADPFVPGAIQVLSDEDEV
jgi:hypothetical protein